MSLMAPPCGSPVVVGQLGNLRAESIGRQTAAGPELRGATEPFKIVVQFDPS